MAVYRTYPALMTRVAYTVVATLPDADLAREYTDWLTGGHAAAVVAAGAERACVIRIEEPEEPIRVEARYEFSSRGALDTYLRDHAPALRAEGLARFGPETGIRLARSIGTIL